MIRYEAPSVSSEAHDHALEVVEGGRVDFGAGTLVFTNNWGPEAQYRREVRVKEAVYDVIERGDWGEMFDLRRALAEAVDLLDFHRPETPSE